uniref:Uncharacterized protein n=2 Tax=Physcomitrium patens TaxID=3218 RepID=A0A7I4BKL4_PHYPA
MVERGMARNRARRALALNPKPQGKGKERTCLRFCFASVLDCFPSLLLFWIASLPCFLPTMAPKRRPSARSSRNAPPPATSAESLLAEARRVKQAAERKLDGAAKVGSLEQAVLLFQNALSMRLSLPVQEEALFDLGETFLEMAGALQTRGLHLAGSPFRNEKKKAQALEIQSQASVDASSATRQSFEMYERVCALEGAGELKQEALVNSGNALCEWASLATSTPENKGGGSVIAAELYKQADERYSRALAVTPEDVELLTNIGDCCVQRAELFHSAFQVSGVSNVSLQAWAPVKEIYEHGLQVYNKACANADTRIGDDLGGLLQNWGVGLSSFAERTPCMEDANEAYKQAHEKFRSALQFKRTDITLFIALGESFASQAERIAADPAMLQQMLNSYLLVNGSYAADSETARGSSEHWLCSSAHHRLYECRGPPRLRRRTHGSRKAPCQLGELGHSKHALE